MPETTAATGVGSSIVETLAVADNELEPPLYGKYTWKINNFSQIKTNELRSDLFEVGGHKWYILIYPRGFDVNSGYLSSFLCVSNYEKLLHGWSHLAQFTFAVVHKDHKKSKYSDTFHCFRRQEHDWGWKKFLELGKLFDGFVVKDTLILQVQVQIIRERPDRPFRCLSGSYKRELFRAYFTVVEEVFHSFVERTKNKLGILIQDKANWSSLSSFWMAIDQSARQKMCREKTDAIFNVIIKQFFLAREVTSPLVMECLYNGLKALEGQSKGKVDSKELINSEESREPIVHVEEDMFVLVDDLLTLSERTVMEPLPLNDKMAPQYRLEERGIEGDIEDPIERYKFERHLPKLGRRAIEIFVLSHVFSKVETAYRENKALMMQEQLILEEATSLGERKQKAKHGASKKGCRRR